MKGAPRMRGSFLRERGFAPAPDFQFELLDYDTDGLKGIGSTELQRIDTGSKTLH